MKKIVITCLCGFILVINFSCLAQSRMIIVDKPNLQLYVIEQADTLLSAPVCVGANHGDKVNKGDQRTPEVKSVMPMDHGSLGSERQSGLI